MIIEAVVPFNTCKIRPRLTEHSFQPFLNHQVETCWPQVPSTAGGGGGNGMAMAGAGLAGLAGGFLAAELIDDIF